MGVLGCHRRDCENIMCDRLSDTYGYICYDCFEDLVAFLANYKGNFSDGVQEFMDTSKKGVARGMDRDLIEEQLRREFPDRLSF